MLTSFVSPAADREIYQNCNLHQREQSDLPNQKWEGTKEKNLTKLIYLMFRAEFLCYNSVFSPPQATSWSLVDIPGHDSLRTQFVEKFKDSAR